MVRCTFILFKCCYYDIYRRTLLRIWKLTDFHYFICYCEPRTRPNHNKQFESLSRTSMFTAQSSSLGGNKLVHSRTFCPRAVAQGLAEEEKWKLQGVDVTSFLEFSSCGDRTQSDFSFRGDDLEFGETAGQPSEGYGSCCIAWGWVGAATCRE
jgi:hypothetical protein